MSDIANSGTTAAAAAVDPNVLEDKAIESGGQAKARRNNRLTIGRAGAWALLGLVMVASLFPVYWALRTALSNNNAIIQDTGNLVPPEFTTFNFERVLGADVTQAELAAAGANDTNCRASRKLSNTVSVERTICNQRDRSYQPPSPPSRRQNARNSGKPGERNESGSGSGSFDIE